MKRVRKRKGKEGRGSRRLLLRRGRSLVGSGELLAVAGDYRGDHHCCLWFLGSQLNAILFGRKHRRTVRLDPTVENDWAAFEPRRERQFLAQTHVRPGTRVSISNGPAGTGFSAGPNGEVAPTPPKEQKKRKVRCASGGPWACFADGPAHFARAGRGAGLLCCNGPNSKEEQ